MDKIRVVLADDHFVVRNGIRTLIDGSEIEIIGEANNGVEAVETVKRLSPDVILMDISMPQMNGLDATEIISKQYKNSKSLILSMYDNEEYILSAVEAGALGYLLKDAPREEILNAIRTVARGDKYFNSSVSNIIINGYLKVKKSAIFDSETKIKLSKKEMVILKQIVDGLNSRQIAEKLELSIRTVDNHRLRMMKKTFRKKCGRACKNSDRKEIFLNLPFLMRDITHKQITLRTATASGIVFCNKETIELITNNKIPKGNIFEFARAAAFMAAKKTDDLLPHCHPVTIDGMEIEFELIHTEGHRNGIQIKAEAKSIGRTGIEMEVLTGVSIAALTIYDMLKPVDKQLEISAIKLLDKKGGKSDRKKYFNSPPTCAVLVCSDSTAEGKREDNSGKKIIEILQEFGVEQIDYKIVSDEKNAIQTQIKEWVSKDIHFIFTTGGTGLGPRDNTVTAVKELLERDADGVTEAIRSYGQMRTPLAMMSRAVAGSIAQTLVVTLPGSTDGAREGMEAIVPGIFHARKMLKGGGH